MKSSFGPHCLAVAFAVLTAFFGCTPEEQEIPVSAITLSPSFLELTVGESATLSALVSPSDATDKTIVWSSDAPGVASVQDGIVMAVDAGSTRITAASRDGSVKAYCPVSVREKDSPVDPPVDPVDPPVDPVDPPVGPTEVAVTGITLSESTVNIYVNQSITLVATVEPADATNKNVSWTSSSASNATVDEKGTVTGLNKGTATITATTEDGGFTAECKVIVNHIYPTKLTIVAPDGVDPDTGIVAGESFRLKVVFEPEDATYRQVDWESMPTAYATYTAVADDEIEVQPLKPGKALVKIANNPGLVAYWPGPDKDARFTINYAPAQAVVFEQSEITLGYYTGKADSEKNFGSLSAKVLPEEFAKQELEWWSDDPGIFEILYTNGKTTCYYLVKGVGTTTVHARSASCPDVQGDCIVNITDERIYVQSIELSSTYLQRAPGSQFDLKATIYPDNVNYYDFEWQFDEESLLIYNGTSQYPPSLRAAPLKVGTMPIRLVDKISGISAECQIEVTYKNPAGYYHWVDLGLSVLWAKYNYWSGFYPGISTRYPPANDRWTYLAFGEFEGKEDYSEATYIYKTSYQLWDLMGEDGCLKRKYDVMSQYSGNSQWRLPSSEEWQELYDGCTWEPVTVDGVTGMQGTSKINGETIFLPYAGRMNGKKVEYESYDGFYWSRTMNQDATPDRVNIYRQYKNGSYDIGMDIHNYVNFQGFTVRGVLPKVYNE